MARTSKGDELLQQAENLNDDSNTGSKGPTDKKPSEGRSLYSSNNDGSRLLLQPKFMPIIKATRKQQEMRDQRP